MYLCARFCKMMCICIHPHQEVILETSAYKSEYVNVNGVRLHYLDWGGPGTVLLFLTGMGNSAYIYKEFAPRFTDRFHVIALTRRGHGDSDYPETGYDADTLTEDVVQFMDSLEIDQAILVGHSMSHVELSHLAALHPQRILKLVFLDAAIDRTSAVFKSMREQNPLRQIQIPGISDDHYSIEDYTAAVKRNYPSFAAIWCDLLDEDLLHSVRKGADGKILDRMSDAISNAINDTLSSYVPEDSKIEVPTLSIYAINSSRDYLSPHYMTEEQKELVMDYFDTIRPALQRELIAQFQRNVPHARILEIPDGHHYCFIKHDKIVFDEMRKFL
jgi:non-heme chloroperoxidase